jgi:hypothetical protein
MTSLALGEADAAALVNVSAFRLKALVRAAR